METKRKLGYQYLYLQNRHKNKGTKRDFFKYPLIL